MLGAQDTTVWSRCLWEWFDLSCNLLGYAEQQPTSSGISLMNLGFRSHGSYSRHLIVPVPTSQPLLWL